MLIDWVPNQGACIDACLSCDVTRSFRIHNIEALRLTRILQWNFCWYIYSQNNYHLLIATKFLGTELFWSFHIEKKKNKI